MKTLALVWGTNIPSNRNTTRFQRAASLAAEYDCAFYTWGRGTIPDGVAIPERSVHVCPGRTVFSRLIFPFWVLYNVALDGENSPDAVHTSYHRFCIFSGFLCSLAGKTWIMDIWDHPLLGLESMQDSRRVVQYLSLLLYRFTYLIAMRCIRRADLIVLSLHSEFAWEHGLPEENTVTVPNGTDLSLYRDVTAHTTDDFNVIYVGYLMKERGMDTLIDATADLQTRIPRCTVTLVGHMTTEDERWLRRRIRDEGIADSVDVVGRLSHEKTLKRIAASDVCLYPFPRKRVLEYIYPIKIFEYMALRKAIVASDLRGARQILTHGETGILIEPDDSDALAEAVYRLYDDAQLRNKIGQRAERAAEQYDWPQINRKFIKAIDIRITSSD